uniref:PK4 n=1 Tax=Arundo donax TaxID=35708 RepID=A0A0A9ERN4_ARUDO
MSPMSPIPTLNHKHQPFVEVEVPVEVAMVEEQELQSPCPARHPHHLSRCAPGHPQ